MIVVSQFRQRNISNPTISSRDLLACMAVPQTGQWRMGGLRDGSLGGVEFDVTWKISANCTGRDLIQINLAGGRGVRRSDLGQCKVGRCGHPASMWQSISTAPFDRDIELAVIDTEGAHALVFPCRRILGGWMNAETKERMDVRPTHWRAWESGHTSQVSSG